MTLEEIKSDIENRLKQTNEYKEGKISPEKFKYYEDKYLEILLADSDICVYCGKKLDKNEPMIYAKADNIKYAKASMRYFPVCSSECEKNLIDFIQEDKKEKDKFYSVAAIGLLIAIYGSIRHISYISMLGILLCGIGLALFPHPITSFDTFSYHSIVKTTKFVRIIGIIIIIAELIFLAKTFLFHI